MCSHKQREILKLILDLMIFYDLLWNLGLGKYHVIIRNRFLLLIFRRQQSIGEYLQPNEEYHHQF